MIKKTTLIIFIFNYLLMKRLNTLFITNEKKNIYIYMYKKIIGLEPILFG